MVKCDYDYNPSQLRSTGSQASNNSPQPSQSSDSTFSRLTTMAMMFSEMYGREPSQAPRDITIPNQVLEMIAADGESVPAVLATYFRTIDTWMPIIDPDDCKKQIDSMLFNQDVEIASLLLTIYMVTRLPQGTGEGVATPLYFQAKSLQTALTSSGRLSIVVMKSALLIATYEQGHGLFDAAQSTISTCLRMSGRLLSGQYDASQVDVENTDLGRLWWNTVIVNK